jgi:hypothetical protein
MTFLRPISCLAVALAKADAQCVDHTSVPESAKNYTERSIKITGDVRKNAAEQGIAESEAVERGQKEKSAEFVEKCGGSLPKA